MVVAPNPLSLSLCVWHRASLIFAQSLKALHPSTTKDAWLQGKELPSLLLFPLCSPKKNTNLNFHPISLSNQWGGVAGWWYLTSPLLFLSSGNPRHLPQAHNCIKTGPEFMLSNWSFYFHHRNIEKQGLGKTQAVQKQTVCCGYWCCGD